MTPNSGVKPETWSLDRSERGPKGSAVEWRLMNGEEECGRLNLGVCER
jgi:hypothetical protein